MFSTLEPVRPAGYSDFPGLEEQIRSGKRLHGFRSGGGLRVVSICDLNEDEESDDDTDEMLPYGEHCFVQEALRICEEDCQAGGREYSEVYGEGKLYPQYLTGTYDCCCSLDRLMLRGTDWDVTWNGEEFVFDFEYYRRFQVPERIGNQVIKTYKRYNFYFQRLRNPKSNRRLQNKYSFKMLQAAARLRVLYEDERGIVYECTPFVFASGQVGHSTRIVSRPKGLEKVDPFFEKTKIRLKGEKTLIKTFERADKDLTYFLKTESMI